MEKIFEKPHAVPLELIKNGMRKRLAELELKYGWLQKEHDVRYRWIPKTMTIAIENKDFDIQARIVFAEKRYACFVQIPFHLRILVKSPIDDIIKVSLREIEQYLRDLKIIKKHKT